MQEPAKLDMAIIAKLFGICSSPIIQPQQAEKQIKSMSEEEKFNKIESGILDFLTDAHIMACSKTKLMRGKIYYPDAILFNVQKLTEKLAHKELTTGLLFNTVFFSSVAITQRVNELKKNGITINNKLNSYRGVCMAKIEPVVF